MKNRNKKILICTGIYPPDIGGPATYSKLLFDELPQRGFAVDVLSFGEVRCWPKIIRHFFYFLKALKAGAKADVIFAQDPMSVGLPACLASFFLRKKFILKIVGDYAWEQFQNQKSKIKNQKFITPEDFQNKKFDFITELRRKVERWVAKRADKIIVPSEYLKKIVLMWGVEESKIKVIYNAFEFVGNPISHSKCKKSDFVVISAGRPVPWKGFETLKDLMPEIEKEIPEAKLIILQQESHEKVLRYLQEGDLFVLNTGYEGLSHQILEAMAAGIPVVTTNVGGNPELIENNHSGFLVEYNNKEQIKKAILDLYKSKELREKFIKNAKEKAKEFGKEKMINETIKILLAPLSGVKVLMISTDKKIFEENSEVRQRVVEYGKLVEKLYIMVLKRPFKLLKIGKDVKGFDLITAQDPFECGFIGWWLTKYFKAKLQLQIHTDFLSPFFWQESFKNKIRVLLAKFLIPRADCVRVVSERIKKSLVASGYTLKSITVLSVWVDVKKIQDSSIKTDLRQKYPQFDFIILMASRLSKEKNIGLAIEAMFDMVKDYPKTGLIIVGNGSERNALKLQITNYKLQKNIILEKWSEDITSYYKTCDLFLLTSNYEGYGRTLIEAAAAGCNIISSDIGVADEILEKENIFNVGNRNELREKIVKAIKGDIQKARPLNLYTKEEYLKRYKEAWRSL